MVRTWLCWDANSKTKEQFSPAFLCFWSPTDHLRPSIIIPYHVTESSKAQFYDQGGSSGLISDSCEFSGKFISFFSLISHSWNKSFIKSNNSNLYFRLASASSGEPVHQDLITNILLTKLLQNLKEVFTNRRWEKNGKSEGFSDFG